MKNKSLYIILAVLVIGIIAGQISLHRNTPPVPPPSELINFNSNSTKPSMEITSPVFAGGQSIPSEFTCEGENTNPPLQIANVPPDAKSLALTLKDPDAPGGNFTHWVVWNIPPSTRTVTTGDALAGATQGLNGANRTGYVGPCPPSGEHRYFFRIYALDSMLSLDGNSSEAQLDQAMGGHIIAQSELMGVYRKK